MKAWKESADCLHESQPGVDTGFPAREYLLLTERDDGWKICPLKGSSGSTGTEVEWEEGPCTSPATGLRVRLWYILNDSKEHLVLTGNAEKNQKKCNSDFASLSYNDYT